MRPLITQYQARSDKTLHTPGQEVLYQAAYNRYMQSGGDPMLDARVKGVPGAERLGFWWLLFYTVSLPLILAHYWIRIARTT